MKRVLIVDDAIDLGRLLQDALRTVHPDIPITVVPSAEEALLESTRFTIDLLVTDWRLPGMSGLELIRKIRVRQPNVKVILMTGLTPDDRMARQKDEASPDIFLRKPMMPSVFLDAVDQLFGENVPVEKAQAVAAHVPSSDSAKEDMLKEMEKAAVLPGEPVQPGDRPPAARKGTGMLSEPSQAASEETLSTILSRLRSSLGAHLALLLDERGHPVARAGDLPDAALESQLVPPVMSSLSAGAKIPYLLGPASMLAVQAYRGTNFDLVTSAVGQYVLLIALRSGRSAVRLAIAFEEALNAQAELALALEGMGLHVQSVVEAGAPEVMLAEMGVTSEPAEEAIPLEILETPLGQDPGLEKFEELFTRKTTGQLNLQDPDDFWATAASGDKKEVTQPGTLSFEQAQKLGLLPSEKE